MTYTCHVWGVVIRAAESQLIMRRLRLLTLLLVLIYFTVHTRCIGITGESAVNHAHLSLIFPRVSPRMWPSVVNHQHALRVLCSFLHMRDAVRLSSINIATHIAVHNPAVLCASIAWSPLGSERFLFWEQWMGVNAATERTLAAHSNCVFVDRLHFYFYALRNFDESVLQLPISEWQHVGGKASLKRTGQEGEILRDLPRTFPHNRLFQGDDSVGQNMLANILRALLVVLKDIGYCQGMNFVTATIMMARVASESSTLVDQWVSSRPVRVTTEGERVAPPLEYVSSAALLRVEADAFWLMLALLTNPAHIHMRDLWGPGTPKVKLRSFQYDQLLRKRLPELHAHFKTIQFTPDVLVSQWFMTLFCYTLTLEMTLHVWDFIFFQGWPGIFAVSLAILDLVAHQLTAMSLDDVGMMMRKWRSGQLGLECTSRELILRALKVRVTAAQLQSLQDQFAMELLRELQVHLKTQRMLALPTAQDDQGEWLFRYGDPHDMLSAKELQEFMKGLSQMKQETTTDVAALQEKINQASKVLEHARRERDATGKETARMLQHLRGLIEERERLKSQAQKMLDDLDAGQSVGSPPHARGNGRPNSFDHTTIGGRDLESDDTPTGKLLLSGKFWTTLRPKKRYPNNEVLGPSVSSPPKRSTSVTEFSGRPLSAFDNSHGRGYGQGHNPTPMGSPTKRPLSTDDSLLRYSRSFSLQTPISSSTVANLDADIVLPGRRPTQSTDSDGEQRGRDLAFTGLFDGPDELDDAHIDPTGISRKWNMLLSASRVQQPDGPSIGGPMFTRHVSSRSSDSSDPSSPALPHMAFLHAHFPNQPWETSPALAQGRVRTSTESIAHQRFSDSEDDEEEEDRHLPNALAFDYDADEPPTRSSVIGRVLSTISGSPIVNSGKEKSPKKSVLNRKRFEKISQDTRSIQVIRLERDIAHSTNMYQKLAEEYQVADTALEEAEFWKASLCKQLMQVVEEASTHRSERLQQIADQLSR